MGPASVDSALASGSVAGRELGDSTGAEGGVGSGSTGAGSFPPHPSATSANVHPQERMLLASCSIP